MQPFSTPVPRSFEEAWQTFLRSESVVTYEQVAADLAKGRGQAITFTVPVEDTEIVTRILETQAAIADIPGLSLLPEEDLHILLKLAGFQVIRRTFDDDLLREEVPVIDQQATALFPSVSRFAVQVRGVSALPNTVILEVEDDGMLRRLNATLTEHISLLHRYPTDSLNYLPYISVAIFEDGSGLQELKRRLSELREHALGEIGVLEVRAVQLTRYWLLPAGPEIDPIKTYYLR